MNKRNNGIALVAVMLTGALLFTACGKISLATLLVLDPAATNTLKITVPEDAGGKTVTSYLVGNIHTTVTVDSNKLLNVGGAPGTVKVNSFDVAGTSIRIGVIPTNTLCVSIPQGATAGGTCTLNPIWTKKASFNLSIPTETIALNPALSSLIPPIPLTLNIGTATTMDLSGLLTLMSKGTGLTMHVVLNLTIPADIPIVGGSAVVMDTTMTSTKTAVTDSKLDECAAALRCGNGVVEAGETCDTAITSGAGACPTSCDDVNACTADTMTGSQCTATCVNTAISECKDGDGCCPEGCNNATDSDCPAVCEKVAGTWIAHLRTTGAVIMPTPINTVRDVTIDVVQRMVVTPANDGTISYRLDLCEMTNQNLSSTNYFKIDYSDAVMATFTGTATGVTACLAVGDTLPLPNFTIMTGWLGTQTTGTCPAPFFNEDGYFSYATYPWNCDSSDYPTSCQNTCVLPSSCRNSLDSDKDCIYGIHLPTTSRYGENQLFFNLLAGMTMSITHNNMVLTAPDTIDGTATIPIVGWVFGSDAGATGRLRFVPDTTAVRVHAAKLTGDVPCSAVQSICPGGAGTGDCPNCGNGIVEPGETCDGSCSEITCPDDGNGCTNEVLTGNAATCNVVCTHPTIPNCCGNRIVEAGETCDGNCPTSCSDGDSCTSDSMTGSSLQCNLSCENTPITACGSGDFCCPTGCDEITDTDCSNICGNGIIESPEICDGNCPTTCPDDGDRCTVDIMRGSPMTCDSVCVYTPITECVGGDGCCPSGCDEAIDTDCILCEGLGGTWIAHLSTTGTIIMPTPINTVSNITIDIVQRLVTTAVDVNTVRYRLDLCKMTSQNLSSTNYFKIDYSDAVMATFTGTSTGVTTCPVVGDTLPLPNFTIMTGWLGTQTTGTCPAPVYTDADGNPLQYYWRYPWLCDSSSYPTSCVSSCLTPDSVLNGGSEQMPYSCRNSVDSDKDCLYGIYLPTTTGGLYINALGGMTMNITFNNIGMTAPDTIEGTATFPVVGWVFGSDASATGRLRVIPDSTAVRVHAVQLAGDVPCSEVLAICPGGAGTGDCVAPQ